MQVLRILVLLVFAIGAKCQVSEDGDDDCMTPNSELGTCVSLMRCESIVSRLSQATGPALYELQRVLRDSNCGYSGTTPMVCCPQISQRAATRTTSTTTLPPIPTIPSGFPSISLQVEAENPPDVTNHPNLSLLPSMNRCGPTTRNKIFGGAKTEVGEFPWMALIAYANTRGDVSFQCGGTVINRRYVLTAAHCISGLGRGMRVFNVRVGEHDIRTDVDCSGSNLTRVCMSGAQDIAIEQLIPHPDFTRARMEHDVGLIRLSTAITYSDTVQPICLPTTRTLSSLRLEGQLAILSGWGVTELRSPSPQLLQANMTIIANTLCSRTLAESPYRVGFRQICTAGTENGVSACRADSGGPLKLETMTGVTINYVQYGIVSFGPVDCGTPNIPEVYTKVPYYMDWILNQIRA